jgi:thioredoxin 1
MGELLPDPEIYEPKTMEEYIEMMKTSGIIIIDFYATWCKPCKRIIPIYRKLADKYNHFTFMKLNISNLEFKDLLSSLDVIKLPSFGFFENQKLLTLRVGPDMEALE